MVCMSMCIRWRLRLRPLKLRSEAGITGERTSVVDAHNPKHRKRRKRLSAGADALRPRHIPPPARRGGRERDLCETRRDNHKDDCGHRTPRMRASQVSGARNQSMQHVCDRSIDSRTTGVGGVRPHHLSHPKVKISRAIRIDSPLFHRFVTLVAPRCA